MQAGGIAGSSSDLVSDRDREEAEAGLEERSVFLYVLGGFAEYIHMANCCHSVESHTYKHAHTCTERQRRRDGQTHKQKSKTKAKLKTRQSMGTFRITWCRDIFSSMVSIE